MFDTWVDIPWLQSVILILMGGIAWEISHRVGAWLERSWKLKNGRRIECELLGCNFVAESNIPEVTQEMMKTHRKTGHLI